MLEEESDESPEGAGDGAGGDAGEKPKIKHTVEAAEVPAFLVLAAVFDILSGLPTIAGFVVWLVGLVTVISAPIAAAIGFIIMTSSATIATVGTTTFMIIWLTRGVMPWSKKYWSWYLISFFVKMIPFLNLIPAYIMLELRMIAQSRIEDRLARTTGLAQAAVQVAKFKTGQRMRQKTAALKAAGAPKELLKERQQMQKAMRVLSTRTIRRTLMRDKNAGVYQNTGVGAAAGGGALDSQMLGLLANEPGFKEALQVAELSGLMGTRPLPKAYRNVLNNNLDGDIQSAMREKKIGGSGANSNISKTQTSRKLTPAEAKQAGLDGLTSQSQKTVTNFGAKSPNQRAAEQQSQAGRLPLRGAPQPQSTGAKSVSGTRLPGGDVKPAPASPPPPKPPLTNAEQIPENRGASLNGTRGAGAEKLPGVAQKTDTANGASGRETPGGVAPLEPRQTTDGSGNAVSASGGASGSGQSAGPEGRETPGGVATSRQAQSSGGTEKAGPSDTGAAPAYEKDVPTNPSTNADTSPETPASQPAATAPQSAANQNAPQATAPDRQQATQQSAGGTTTSAAGGSAQSSSGGGSQPSPTPDSGSASSVAASESVQGAEGAPFEGQPAQNFDESTVADNDNSSGGIESDDSDDSQAPPIRRAA